MTGVQTCALPIYMDLSTSNLVEAYWEIDILKDIYFIPKKVNKRKSYELIRDEEF